MNAKQTFFRSICNEIMRDKKANKASKLLYLFDYDSRYEFKTIKGVPWDISCDYHVSSSGEVEFKVDDLIIPIEDNKVDSLMEKDQDEIVKELIKSFIQVVNDKLLNLGLVRILSKILINKEEK